MNPNSLQRHLRGLFGLAAAGFGPLAAAISIDVFPSNRSLELGQTFQVQIRAAEVPSFEVLTYFGLLLGYDANVLEALDVDFSDALGSVDMGESFGDSVLDVNPNDVTAAGGVPAGYQGSYTHAVEFANFTDPFALDPSTLTGNQTDFDYLKGLQSPEPTPLATISFQLSTEAPAGSYELALITDADFTHLGPDQDASFYDIKGREFFNILTTTTENARVLVVSAPPPATLLPLALLPLLARRRRT